MILNIIQNKTKKKEKIILPLIDPDKYSKSQLSDIVNLDRNIVPFVLIGGSLISSSIETIVDSIKEQSDIPVVLYPGSPSHITKNVDAILFLSMISGRNPDLLIGHHVVAAPILKQLQIESIPTGYMLIDGGTATSVEYISQTQPIPADKDEIAVATAIAGEMLGLKVIYMDAGSGAQNPISSQMIASVKNNINIPLIIGGGIRDANQVAKTFKAGADIIIVGTAFEQKTDIIKEMVEKVKKL